MTPRAVDRTRVAAFAAGPGCRRTSPRRRGRSSLGGQAGGGGDEVADRLGLDLGLGAATDRGRRSWPRNRCLMIGADVGELVGERLRGLRSATSSRTRTVRVAKSV